MDTPTSPLALLNDPSLLKTDALIGGEWVAGSARFEVTDPATGLKLAEVANLGAEAAETAIAAANKAWPAWRGKTAKERAAILMKWFQLLHANADDLARIMTAEQGKPLAEAKVETMASADIIEWFADESLRVYGRIVPSRNLKATQMVLKDPVGPVAAFTPWNFPINQVVRKLAAALGAGCSILVKAPEETPASPAELIRAFADAGVPAGTVGLVYGDPAEISSYLIPHPIIRKVTFTGSTPVGKQLAALAGKHMKRVTMELGGHAPVIVAEDADLELAIKIGSGAKFRNAGQVCISPTRYLVHESIRADFAAAFAKYAQGLKVGDGLTAGTQMGPLANPRRITAMADLLADAVQQGAKVLTGGERIGTEGNFFQPTVLNDVPLSARIVNEEPFGPVAAIRGFEKIEDAIAEANRLPFGLAGYAFTSSLKNAHLLAQRLEVGMLWINQAAAPAAELPFGGLKDSGYGSEGGPEAIEAHLNTRLVSIMNV